MSEPAPEPAPVEDQMAGYTVALAALVAASVAATWQIWDRLSPGLVEELPRRVRGLLIEALTTSWTTFHLRGHALGSLGGAAVLTRVRGAPVAPDPPPDPAPVEARLRRAATTLVERVEAMQVGADGGGAPAAFEDFDAELRALEELRAREAAAEDAEIAAELREVEDARAREDAAEQAEIDAELAAVEAEDRAEERQAVMDAARERRAARAERAAERREAAREARSERRRAQRDRAARVARAEVYAAAHQALTEAVETAPEVLGWIRKLGDTACPTCIAWWKSGGTTGGPTPVRPMSVKMKRHLGCDCIQVPVTSQEIVDVRGIEYRPEPVTERWKRERDRGRNGD